MAATHHFGNVEIDEPERYFGPSDYDRWVHGNCMHLRSLLPELRQAFLGLLREESQAFGLAVAADCTGDAMPPDVVVDAFGPFQADFILLHAEDAAHSEIYKPQHVLTEALRARLGHRRAVSFENDLFPIPDALDRSVVEVWFRRVYGRWDDGGPYPCFIVPRPYGWQAYGVER